MKVLEGGQKGTIFENINYKKIYTSDLPEDKFVVFELTAEKITRAKINPEFDHGTNLDFSEIRSLTVNNENPNEAFYRLIVCKNPHFSAGIVIYTPDYKTKNEDKDNKGSSKVVPDFISTATLVRSLPGPEDFPEGLIHPDASDFIGVDFKYFVSVKVQNPESTADSGPRDEIQLIFFRLNKEKDRDNELHFGRTFNRVSGFKTLKLREGIDSSSSEFRIAPLEGSIYFLVSAIDKKSLRSSIQLTHFEHNYLAEDNSKSSHLIYYGVADHNSRSYVP